MIEVIVKRGQFMVCGYLVVIEEVHKGLHDAREHHHTCAGDEEGVDIIQRLVLFLFGS